MKTLWIIALLLTGGLAARAQVSTDYDKNVDFTKYKTYAWLKPDIKVGSNPLYQSDLITRNIQQDVAAELGKRGLRQVSANPDLLIGFHTYTEQKTQTYNNNTGPLLYPGGFIGGWRYFPYGYGNWPYAWNNNIQTVQYTEGTLVLDFVDAKTNMLVWRGAVQGAVNNPNKIEKEVAKGVRKALKKYPVQSV